MNNPIENCHAWYCWFTAFNKAKTVSEDLTYLALLLFPSDKATIRTIKRATKKLEALMSRQPPA